MFLCHSVPLGDFEDEGSRDLNMAAVSPIPKIVTTSIIEDFSREDEDGRDEWGESEPENNVEINHQSINGNVLVIAMWTWREFKMQEAEYLLKA